MQARPTVRRRAVLAGLSLLLAGLVVPVASGAPDTVEVWRLHPSAAAAREADFDITVSWVGSGDRGAVMLVEDRHIPAYSDDDAGIGFARVELADTNLRPEVYDRYHGVDATDCQEAVIGQCSSHVRGSSSSDRQGWHFTKPRLNSRPDPRYLWHDIYVGAVNARISDIRLTGAGWTKTRATNATMVLVQNQDTANGAGAHVANEAVEHFGGAELSVPKGSWAAVSVSLPCDLEFPTPQDDARFSGYTLPNDGRPYMHLSCQGWPFADAYATGPTTVRLTPTSTQPMTFDDWTTTSYLDRLVALVVKSHR